MEQGNKRTPQRFVGREAVVTTQCLNGWLVVFYLPFMLMSDFMAWHIVETQFLHPTWSLFRCLANECHLAIILYIDRINQLINLLQVSTQDIYLWSCLFFRIHSPTLLEAKFITIINKSMYTLLSVSFCAQLRRFHSLKSLESISRK